jgi:hypothetical protein
MKDDQYDEKNSKLKIINKIIIKIPILNIHRPVFCAPIGLICACAPKNENDLDKKKTIY